MSEMQYSCWWCGTDVDEDSETIYVEEFDCPMPICTRCSEEREMVTE